MRAGSPVFKTYQGPSAIPAGSPPLDQSGDLQEEDKKLKGANSGESRAMQECDDTIEGEKITCYKSTVRRCIVVMEQPIACEPQFR